MEPMLPRVCPRCRGSMIAEKDWYGAYSSCLSCGYVHEAVSPPAIELLEEDESGRVRQRRRQPSHGKLRL
jgi:DNA-directed RNA polymerase subunit M/transcription elongation factor TFIIS